MYSALRGILLAALFSPSLATANPADSDLGTTYRFLVTKQSIDGGALYEADSGPLRGARLPLSFYSTWRYWGDYVCQRRRELCAVTDVYDSNRYTLTPLPGVAGDLQTERVNADSGTNIYDAATWQIAVALGLAVNHFDGADALADNQNRALQASTNRAPTRGELFRYNGHPVANGAQAYVFRTIARSWLAPDPLIDTPYKTWIAARDLPPNNREYAPGKITWTDWKPITGENVWAFLLGPLHAAHLRYVVGDRRPAVPFADLAIQNALAMLPTFASMQSEIGAVYYAPAGTIVNQGTQPVNPHQVSVENNASLYAGLRVLEATLRATRAHEKELSRKDASRIDAALTTIDVMIGGGQTAGNARTAGLLSFFKTDAWRNREFVQGGLANDPNVRSTWVSSNGPRAVDANTWTVAALGARQIDEWFGFGASYEVWQRVKRWGAYGVDGTLWGVGYSDRDGNGIAGDGKYRQGILSSEWTAGAITMLRNLIEHYSANPQAATFVRSLQADEKAMLTGLDTLRFDRYLKTDFPGKPAEYERLLSQTSTPYLYASKRYLIPFGWYANPIPSTCATSWAVMVHDRYDPFGYAGKPVN